MEAGADILMHWLIGILTVASLAQPFGREPFGREPLGRGAFGRSTQPAAEAAAYVGILDSLAAVGEAVLGDSTGAWCVIERLTVNYTGALFRVRRVSDDAEADIPYVAATGKVNLDSLNSFLSATTGKYVKIYEQIGGNDLVQATAANQPDVTLTSHGIYPSLTFLLATVQYMSVASTSFGNVSTGDVTNVAVTKSSKSDGAIHLIISKVATSGSVNGWNLGFDANEKTRGLARTGGNAAVATGPTGVCDGNWRTLTGTFETADDSSKAYLDNGVLAGGGANALVTTLTNAAAVTIGAAANANLPMTGNAVMYFVCAGTQPGSITRAGLAAHFAGLE